MRIRECEHPRHLEAPVAEVHTHATSRGCGGHLATRVISLCSVLSPCFQALLHDVRGWESSLQIYARVFFPAQNILEAPRQDEKKQG